MSWPANVTEQTPGDPNMERNVSIHKFMTVAVALLLIVASLKPQCAEASLSEYMISRKGCHVTSA